MVVQAPPDSKNPPQPMRPSPVTNISKISSLKRYPDRDYALDLLHQMAKAVAPLIHQYNFKVGLLCEMYPKSPALLGLNVNGGQKILIRLRMPYNDRLFYPMSDLIGTFLHELTHNVHGPHDSKFYRLLDELKAKFVTGGFASDSYVCEENKLGSAYSPFATPKSVRDKRLEALSKGFKAEARRLGGNASDQRSMREAALRAAERRLKDSKWCPLADLNNVDLDDALGHQGPGASEKMKEYKQVIDLTKAENEQDDDVVEIIEIDACDSLLLVHQVDTTKLWANALKPSLDDDACSFLTSSIDPHRLPDVPVQYRASNSPGKTFIGDEHLYPRRKLVADLDFDQIIEKGRLIQATPIERSEARAEVATDTRMVEKRTKKLPHPEEILVAKRKVKTGKQPGSKDIVSDQNGPKKTTKGKKTIKAEAPSTEATNPKPQAGSKPVHPKKPKPSRTKSKSVDKKENKKQVQSISFEELLG